MTTISNNPYSSISALLNPVNTNSGSGSTDVTSELDTLLGKSDNSSSGNTNPTLSLLSGSSDKQSALSSSVLSALQQYQETNSTAVAGLFGNDTNSLTGGIEDVNSVYNQALQTAKNIAAANGHSDSSGSGSTGTAPAATDATQALLSGYNTALNAYNTTLLQQAKTVLEDNSSLTA